MTEVAKETHTLPGEVKDEMGTVQLRHVSETKEKVVLPTAEDIQQEKTHDQLMEDIENAEQRRKSLTHVVPSEQQVLPTAEDIRQEKQHDQLMDAIENEDNRKSLTHVIPEEHQCLPTAQDIKTEKTHDQLMNGVEKFNKGKLQPTHTEEKVFKPTAEEIAREKVKDLVAKFDHGKLNPTTTVEKHDIVLTDA